MKCDTCGQETEEVKRVVIHKGYDKTRVRAMYNCQQCYEAKEKTKVYNLVAAAEPAETVSK
ncbi:MAG: hypothetical protein HYS56_03320 [Candidatus Omnitrophica bacterium]|nr:hypothetical protein [Candidatus Omnitrophota bacterium]